MLLLTGRILFCRFVLLDELLKRIILFGVP